jgi:putative serine protease PepD
MTEEIPPTGDHDTQPIWIDSEPPSGDDVKRTEPIAAPSPWWTDHPWYGSDSSGRAEPAAGRDRRRIARYAGVGLALLALMVGSGAAGAALVGGSPSTTLVSSLPASPAASVNGPTEPLARVAAQVLPSVVSITVNAPGETDEGSGIIISSTGTILTNNHVVVNAAGGNGTITVRFNNGRTASATIVGRDPLADVAVIHAQGVSGLRPATLGSVTSLHVGDTVLAIGSPLGLNGSVTAGIVSALNRSVNLQEPLAPSQGGGGVNPFGFQQQNTTTVTVTGAIQTDAAINPGNSGGPLVDEYGRVVGLNTAIASVGSTAGESGNIGVGFAIPIDEAIRIADQLIAGKTPSYAELGVEVTDAPSGGALITQVRPNMPAASAGLKAGDVIVSVDGQSVPDAATLVAIIRSHQPGQRVSITYLRGGSRHTTSVTLANGA